MRTPPFFPAFLPKYTLRNARKFLKTRPESRENGGARPPQEAASASPLGGEWVHREDFLG